MDSSMSAKREVTVPVGRLFNSGLLGTQVRPQASRGDVRRVGALSSASYRPGGFSFEVAARPIIQETPIPGLSPLCQDEVIQF